MAFKYKGPPQHEKDVRNGMAVAERKIGKPKPTSMAQLASVEAAMAWLNSLKTDTEKDREKVDSTDKLQAEVIALRKELEALKKEKQR